MGIHKRIAAFFRAHRSALVGGAVLFVFLCAVFVRFHLSFHFNGIFLLKGKGRFLVELKDDLFLGEGNRLVAAVDFGPLKRAWRERVTGGEPVGLHLEWDEEDGSGFVRQRFPDGKIMVTNFSRLIDDSEKEVHGLVVGGGMPGAVQEGGREQLNDTGMTWYDGKRWFHIWCSTNEGIHGLTNDPSLYSYPSGWTFLGSRVLRNGPHRIVLSSHHRTEVDGVPLRIDRYAYFRAGEPFFLLSIRITNEGRTPAVYTYVYGDEPWLGDFGSSEGNVGWYEGGVVRRVGRVDPRRFRYIGLWDHGNDLVSSRHDFTGVANFLEWLGPNLPDVAYFSNYPGINEMEEAAGTPLSGNSRFTGLRWGPRRLAPGREDVIFLAQGMAWTDPATGFPVKPPVPLAAALD